MWRCRLVVGVGASMGGRVVVAVGGDLCRELGSFLGLGRGMGEGQSAWLFSMRWQSMKGVLKIDVIL